jgi:hypothetical protein
MQLKVFSSPLFSHGIERMSSSMSREDRDNPTCRSLSVITFEPNSSMRAIKKRTLAECGLKSFCIPALVEVVDWCCFGRCADAIQVTFESPCRVRDISNLHRGMRSSFLVPDSVGVLTIDRLGDRWFFCDFGPNSRLQDLGPTSPPHQGFGFMRLSEPSVKRIRSSMESPEH